MPCVNATIFRGDSEQGGFLEEVQQGDREEQESCKSEIHYIKTCTTIANTVFSVVRICVTCSQFVLHVHI